jgi:hypothetical protein
MFHSLIIPAFFNAICTDPGTVAGIPLTSEFRFGFGINWEVLKLSGLKPQSFHSSDEVL